MAFALTRPNRILTIGLTLCVLATGVLAGADIGWDPGSVSKVIGSRVYVPTGAGVAPAAPQPDSWALGVHAVQGLPNPSSVQGVGMTAYLPVVPSGLASSAGPHYMLVLSVIFPNGRFLQIDVRASPAGTDGCLLFACYQSVYNIAKFPGTLSAYAIELEAPGSFYTLAVWRDSAAGKWRYGIARGVPGSLSVERIDYLTNLDANFADADAYGSIAVNQRDEWFGTSYVLQEFAALESYDWSSSDWSQIGSLFFGPALGFYAGNGTATWPSMAPAGAGLTCSTEAVCADPDGRQYLGFIGCCSGVPSFAWSQGLFQGQLLPDAFVAGWNASAASASPGDILWAGVPLLVNPAFSPSAVRTGTSSNFAFTLANPNGFSLSLGFRTSLRPNPGGTPIPGLFPDLGPIAVAPAFSTQSEPIATAGLAEGLYDVSLELWSGAPGTGASRVLAATGWIAAAFAIDNIPPVATASLVGTSGLLGWYRSAVDVQLAAADAVSGVASLWYLVDATNGTPYVRFTGPFSINADGSHNLSFYAIDAAGNAELPQTVHFRIDATAPALRVLSPPDGSALPAGNISISWTSTDPASGLDRYELQLDAGLPVNVSTSEAYTFRGVANGSHAVRLVAFDRAGNEAARALTVQVGAAPPAPLWFSVGTAAAVVAVILVALLLARKRRSPPPP